jgi:sugar phosphate isomerase/epimerase
VHVKDGYWPKEKDKIGDQAAIGQGEAKIGECIKKLAAVGYKGPLIIEREAGEDRIGDILRAKQYIEKIKEEIGIK